jgi:hypothetical protein
MTIPVANLTFLWEVVVNPRLGCAYAWGGSFNPNDVMQGTDCSGADSAELCAMLYGPAGMLWQRQFYTGTFAGANPGDTGPFGGVDCTSELVCVTSPAAAPFGTAMIIAVRQEADPTDAHMIVSVPEFVGGPWTTIEMGGNANNYHLGEVGIGDQEFNQWFILPGPIV